MWIFLSVCELGVLMVWSRERQFYAPHHTSCYCSKAINVIKWLALYSGGQKTGCYFLFLFFIWFPAVEENAEIVA